MDFIKEVICRLENHIVSENYAGYDPYDALSSPIFKLPILRSNKLVRFGVQQLFRRIPINLRPILKIKKAVNPVTLGLCIQAYGYLLKIFPEKYDYYISEINKLLNWLINLSSKGYSGYCWGYNFDWEARYARINAFTPTVVATGIITNGLYEYYKITGDKRIEDIIVSSSYFVLKNLNRTYEGETFCFSYSPNDNQQVFNATMKGARLLVQAYKLTNDKEYLKEAEKTVKFVINNQNPDGSWYYSKGDARKWVDNFHTAYILDCLKSFIAHLKKESYNKYLINGLDYYIKNLFTEKFYPKYYNVSFYPIDSTEVAQAIITLSNFNLINEAKAILEFGIKKLFHYRNFKYQIRKYYSINIPYMRWSNASWFCSLCFYLNKINSQTI
ncbi:MAG: delta-aminolevulinic acid dehydratase [Ignavibacteria bacterium]